jgi:hypothetical protein
VQKESPVNESFRTPGLTADTTVFCHRLREEKSVPDAGGKVLPKGCLEARYLLLGVALMPPTSGFAPSGVRLNRSGSPKVANTAGAFQQLLQ